MMRGLVLLIVGLGWGSVWAADSSAAKVLDRRWAGIEKLQPNLGVRDLFGFALEAAAIGWHPERVAKALDFAEQAQDRDPKSRTFGNFKWYWKDTKPADLNAVEFTMQQGVLVWMLHKDKLDAEGAERLERLLRFGVEGIRRHSVREDYTNIFLMKSWNAIAIGESTNRADLAAEGYAMLDRWLAYTDENGIHEYNSPTYYGTDLDSLGLMARFAQREDGKRKAAAALRLVWTDIAANWFAPCLRLGGAHSRDYDYLTGHGYLDQHLRLQGWIPSPTPFQPSAFLGLCRWNPPAELRLPPVSAIPRIVQQRFGPNPWERATNYVGRHFCIGSAGHDYEPTGKPLTVNFAGGPQMVVVNFLMDARRDPYGRNRLVTGGGHLKSLHLLPFLMSVQRGAEVLFLASIDPASPGFRRWAAEPVCLLSHLVIPSGVEVWIGDAVVTPPAAGGQIDIPGGQAVVLRFQDVAVGVRFVLALDTAGQPAPVALANDGQPGALRLTCTHSATKPEGRCTVALWLRAAEGLDDAAFAAFRKQFASASVETKSEGNRIEVAAAGLEGRLRLLGDVAKGERLAIEGAEPGSERWLLAVNGRDFGREILSGVEPVARYRQLLAAAEKGEAGAARAEERIEAEDAALIVPPFRADADAAASGGKFIWMPGEPGGQGGSPVARALWLVHVPKQGDYRLWARVLTPTPDDDSFFVRVRQGERDALPRSEWHTGVHKAWEWVLVRPGAPPSAAPFRLEPGVALVEFLCREDGARLDALLLTSDPQRTP